MAENSYVAVRTSCLDGHLCVVAAWVGFFYWLEESQGTDPTTGLVHGKRIDPAHARKVHTLQA